MKDRTPLDLSSVAIGDGVTLRVTGGSFTPHGRHRWGVVSADERSFAVDYGMGPWWFHRSNGRSYTGWGQIEGWQPLLRPKEG